MKKYKVIFNVYHIHLEQKLNELNGIGYKCLSVTYNSGPGNYTIICKRQNEYL